MYNFYKSFPVEYQMDYMDCGPACLKLISKFYGKFYSLQQLRDKCGFSREGVSFLDLSYAAENIGLKSLGLKSTIEDLIDKIPLPCIVHWEETHYVVVYKVSNSTIYVSDPAKGLISYSRKNFEKNWLKPNSDRGAVLILEPTADFKHVDQVDSQERSKTYMKILSYFLPYKKSFSNLLFVMFIVTILQAFLPFISKAVIDVGIQTHDMSFINIVLFGNLFLILSITVCNAIRDWILLHITSRINIALVSDYLMKLMKLPITFFESKMTGDILQRANDLERIRSFIMNNSIALFFSMLTFLIFGVILFIFNPVIFYIFIIGSVLYIGWVFLFFGIRKSLDWEYFDLVSKNQSYWVETIEGMQDIKINNYEKSKRWKWEGIQAKLYHVNIRGLSMNNFQNLGAQFIDQIKNLFIIFFCAKAVIAGDITFGVMISTQFIIGMLNGPVNQFIGFIISAQIAQISFLRLHEVHQLNDEESGTNSLDLPDNKNITLNNVSFQYTQHSKFILKNLNMVIPEGKVTAIVGDSGSGKSTLLKLLLRLYRTPYGSITIGSMNLNNISLKEWRDRCGAVMQDGRIFNDTIINNIVLGEENVDYTRLKHAVETANIASEIEQFSLGYQTVMGEMGRGLSGGQKQRLLIARALYKNPDFLFFDEATNSLDVINERKIISSLENIFKDKTVVVVAHRLSTIRKADQIIVLKDGVIAEIGTHEELISHEGRYYELIKTQSDTDYNLNPSNTPN